MILYTPLPLEWVLSGYESFKPEYRELDYQGKKLIVEMISPDQGRIVGRCIDCIEFCGLA